MIIAVAVDENEIFWALCIIVTKCFRPLNLYFHLYMVTVFFGFWISRIYWITPKVVYFGF